MFLFQELLILLAVLSTCFVQGWRLQLCLNGTLFETTDSDCKYGIWFPEPRAIHKVCFEHGIWAIYREFCEENPFLWTVHPGKKGCINHDELGGRIIGIKSLGRDEDAGAIAATMNRRHFFNNHKLKHGMKVDFLNTPAPIEVITWGTPSVIYSVEQVVDESGSRLQQCLMKGKHAFFGYYKIELLQSQNVSFYLTNNLCSHGVMSSENITRVQLLPTEIDFDIIQSSSEEEADEEMNCEKFRRVDDQFEWDEEEDRNELEKDAFDMGTGGKILSRDTQNVVEKWVDDETQRIMMRLIGHHFQNDTIGKGFDQWKFFDVAKQIFLKVCPISMVPHFFINEIYLLFQVVLQESFKVFPELVNKDEKSKERILSALQACLANVTKMEFKDGGNCTEDAPLLKKEFTNGTKVYLLVDMPPFIKVDSVNYDLLMESVWKIMNFAHYYCADTFQNFATDHSLLEGYWYSLFSPLVIRRWKYPGRAYSVMQQLFSSINLERSVRNLDFCVSAARQHSTYKGWLKRPLSHWDKVKKLDLVNGTNLIWNGQAHCLDDFLYPARKLGYPIEKCGIRMPILPRRLLVERE